MQPPHLLLAVLMQLHLREKQELFEANAALRTVLRRQGVPDAQLEAEVKRINAQVGAGSRCMVLAVHAHFEVGAWR